MVIQIPTRNRLIDMLMAISYVPSKGYQVALNESGFICPVKSADESMNVVFKSDALKSFEVEKLLKLSVPDMDSFKKFFKGLPSRDGVVEYDEHLNSITHEKAKLSLNGPDVVPGKVSPSKPMCEEWYRVEIEDIGPLSEMCSHKKIGDKIEINNRKINLYNWDISTLVTDNDGIEIGEEFKAYIDRSMLQIITKIHKKIGRGSFYIKIFRDTRIPFVTMRGDGINYIAYCGKYNEGQK